MLLIRELGQMSHVRLSVSVTRDILFKQSVFGFMLQKQQLEVNTYPKMWHINRLEPQHNINNVFIFSLKF